MTLRSKLKSIKNIKPTLCFPFVYYMINTTFSQALFTNYYILQDAKSQSHLLVSRRDQESAAVVQKKESSDLTNTKYSQFHSRRTKRYIPVIQKKNQTFKSSINLYVVRNFGLELTDFLSQSRSKVRKEDCLRFVIKARCYRIVFQEDVASLWMWTQLEKMSDKQERGTRLEETGATERCYLRGATGMGHDRSEATSRRGELCLHKNGNYRTGQLHQPGQGWIWTGNMGLWLRTARGAEKASQRKSAEALDAVDG